RVPTPVGVELELALAVPVLELVVLGRQRVVPAEVAPRDRRGQYRDDQRDRDRDRDRRSNRQQPSPLIIGRQQRSLVLLLQRGIGAVRSAFEQLGQLAADRQLALVPR